MVRGQRWIEQIGYIIVAVVLAMQLWQQPWFQQVVYGREYFREEIDEAERSLAYREERLRDAQARLARCDVDYGACPWGELKSDVVADAELWDRLTRAGQESLERLRAVSVQHGAL
jgi:hypothetical protein